MLMVFSMQNDSFRIESHSNVAGLLAASPKLLGRAQDMMKHVGTAGIRPLLRKADGGSPTMSRKVRLNVPRLLKPTSKQMSVTLRSVERRRNMARSTRRR